MGQRKIPASEEVEDIKKSLDFLTEEVSAVRLQQKNILDLVEEVKALRLQNAEKDKQLAYLERHSFTGLQTKQWSYAQVVATANGGEPDEQDTNSTEQQVAAFPRSKGINLDCNDIEACHPLPRRNASDKLAIIMRFVNRKHKTALLKQGRKEQMSSLTST
ncbi:hypothetical protein ABVT39_001401 [Epinephelus coioides]